MVPLTYLDIHAAVLSYILFFHKRSIQVLFTLNIVMGKMMKIVSSAKSSQSKKIDGLSHVSISAIPLCFVDVFRIHIAVLTSNLGEWGLFWKDIEN